MHTNNKLYRNNTIIKEWRKYMKIKFGNPTVYSTAILEETFDWAGLDVAKHGVEKLAETTGFKKLSDSAYVINNPAKVALLDEALLNEGIITKIKNWASKKIALWAIDKANPSQLNKMWNKIATRKEADKETRAKMASIKDPEKKREILKKMISKGYDEVPAVKKLLDSGAEKAKAKIVSKDKTALKEGSEEVVGGIALGATLVNFVIMVVLSAIGLIPWVHILSAIGFFGAGIIIGSFEE
jgi:hypothetical protein